jgi:hypothetical protein
VPVAGVTMSAMPTMDMMQGAAEAAMDRAAKGLTLRAWNERESGAAKILSLREARRYGADSGASHHGQHDAA